MIFLAYTRLYAQALANALSAIGRNLWTLVLPMGLLLCLQILAAPAALMGMAGGLLLSLAKSAACSIYTYFVAEVVAKNRVGLGDLRTSIGAYFWTWINLFFVLWIVDLLLGPMSLTEEGQRLRLALSMLELVVLNAAPEVIYLKRTSGGLDTIQRSFVFLQENWIEWFVPNAAILGVVWLVRVGTIPLNLLPFSNLTLPVVAGVLLHVVMVFRGFLFQSLDGSTHRQRMFRFGKRS